MTKEQLLGQEHRYMTLRHMLEDLFKSMSHLKVEGLENIANFEGPAVLYSPHWGAVDAVGTGVAINRYVKLTYKKQSHSSPSALGTWMAMYTGGIAINERKFLAKIFESFDDNLIVLMYPEGDSNLGNHAVGRPAAKTPGKENSLLRIIDGYEKRNKGVQVALIPAGLEYILPPIKRPWPINVPIPWATRLVVRIGEPIYPSEHPEMNMDDYMRIIAKLSNKPYAPDLEK